MLSRPRLQLHLVFAMLFALLLAACSPGGSANTSLPAEAIDTLVLIQDRGPFPYRKDGSVFHNRERLLPPKTTGYYREYTVPTPGARDRGARRIVSGGDPPTVFYYTDDHYRSFRQVEPRP